MVIKINRRPIKVEESPKRQVNWYWMGCYGFACLMIFYVLDYAAAIFVGIHPFPWIKFMGVFLKWLG